MQPVEPGSSNYKTEQLQIHVEGEVLSEHQFQLFDSAVRFRSRDPRLIEVISYLYEPNRLSKPKDQETVVEINQRDGFYELYVPGLPLSFYRNEWELFLHFKARLIEFFWRGKTKPLVLHAGAIAKNGRGVLLVGPDGAGKSTLTLGLVNRGFRYLSDEYGIIDLDTGLLRYHPAPHAVRENSFLLQQNVAGLRQRVRYDLYEINVWDEEEHRVRKPLFPAPIPGGEPLDNVPISMIVFLEPNFSSSPTATELPNKEDVLAELLRNATWHAQWSQSPKEKVEQTLRQIIVDVPIYKLSVGFFDETLDMIDKLVSQVT